MLSPRQSSAARSGGLSLVGASFAGRVIRDAIGAQPTSRSREEHLTAAVAWLERAQRATPDGGVSYGFSIKGGWRPSYRETSGYIAVTFFDLAERFSDPSMRELALTVSDWLCEIQEPDGSIANPRYNPDQGIVFDTGQVLLGYVRAYRETGEARYLEAANRAAGWLASRLDDDGAWRRNTHLGNAHTYNTRVAWAMLEANDVAPNPEIEEAARRNLDWALTQATGGYFRNCAFEPGLSPFTHTIAYAIRGILEAGRLLDEAKYADAARGSADAVIQLVRDDGWIPGQIDESGRAGARYCCLTGNCQLAIIWLKLHATTGEVAYFDAARRALEYVMSCQDLGTSNEAIAGAIKGSQPIWGRYAPLSYPNWATKFFVDAMLLLEKAES